MRKSNEIKEYLNEYQELKPDYDEHRFQESDDKKLKMLNNMFNAIYSQSDIGQHKPSDFEQYKKINYINDSIPYTGI